MGNRSSFGTIGTCEFPCDAASCDYLYYGAILLHGGCSTDHSLCCSSNHDLCSTSNHSLRCTSSLQHRLCRKCCLIAPRDSQVVTVRRAMCLVFVAFCCEVH